MYKEFDLSIMILRALLSANAVEVANLNNLLCFFYGKFGYAISTACNFPNLFLMFKLVLSPFVSVVS